MMILVRLIDVLVEFIKVLGGRTRVNPVLRVGMWLTLLCVLTVGLAAVAGLSVLLYQWLESL